MAFHRGVTRCLCSHRNKLIMSKITQALIECPHCHSVSEYDVWVSANVTVCPHLKEEVLSGSLFWKECPKCSEGFSASHDLLYHDMEKQFCVWLKYENAAGEIELERGADRADRVFEGYRLRIAFVRDELIEKIKIAQDGYDDIFIEALKVFHSAKFDIDFASPFYYDRTVNRMSRKTIVFLHRPDGSDPMEHTMDLRDARSAIEPFVPKISAALKSDWSPWMWVSRPSVLMTFEECGLLSGAETPETVQNIPASLLEKGETLVMTANSVAVASLTSAERKLELPEGLTNDVEKWDFSVTVAGVFAALHALGQRVSDETIDEITSSRVLRKLDEWNPEGSRAFSDCRQFVEGSLQSASEEQIELTAADAIGMWLLCKLYRRFPTPEETADARPLGGFLLDTFAEWWFETN
jgi:CpXC protein